MSTTTYRLLNVGETIQDGDEVFTQGAWKPAVGDYGETVTDWCSPFRRAAAPSPVVMPEGVREPDREAAAKAIQPFFTEGKIYASDLEYWAWPQTFGSTVGPFGGAGGASMTVFTIEAYAFGSLAAIMCRGKVLRVTDDFRPCGDYTKMPRPALTGQAKKGEV